MAEAKGSYVGGTPVYFKDEKARAMLSNEYVPAENYAAGNLCIHEGKLYKATKATTGTWDATAWTETNLAEVNAGMQKSITDLTENTGRLHFSQINYTTDQFGQISTIIPNSKIISAWCNIPRSFVVPVSEDGTGLCIYISTNKSTTADNIKFLNNTYVNVNVLYYDF